MDGARDAVLQLEVHLGDGVLGKDRGVGDVTCEKRMVSLVFALLGLGVIETGEGKVIIRIAADSTMLRMVNLLIALSLGVHREQLEQRMGFTWPRPFLLRPLFFLYRRNHRQHFLS